MTSAEAKIIEEIRGSLTAVVHGITNLPKFYAEKVDELHQTLGRAVEAIAKMPSLDERTAAISKIREAIADLVSTPVVDEPAAQPVQ